MGAFNAKETAETERRSMALNIIVYVGQVRDSDAWDTSILLYFQLKSLV